MDIPNSVLKRIEEWAEEPIQMLSHQHKGNRNTTAVIQLRSGLQYFVKYSFSPDVDMSLEVRGLQTIEQKGVIPTPVVRYCEKDLILMDYFVKGKIGYNFFYNFGAQLAKLHEESAITFGLSYDNYLGSTPQLNVAEGEDAFSWTSFFWNKRLLPQYRLIEQKDMTDRTFVDMFSKLEKVFPKILQPVESDAPSLLHGDLWSGNYLTGEDGQAVLIDPAIYYGHREADLAMTSLFGGFDSDFYKGYDDTLPLSDDWENRQNIYKLYHMMNHMNIYGTAYRPQAIGLMSYYVY